jgi:CHRD domain
MKKFGVPAALILVLLVALGIGSYAIAGGGKKHLKADQMTGYQENPDLSTTGAGRFEITIDDDAETFDYELTFSELEGNVTQAHIHFAKRALNAGIVLWLCGTATNPGPAGTPACPAPGGTVSRQDVGVADILAPGTQGIEAGNFKEFAAALREGQTYANVHSTKWPGGEIRGQINDQRNG